MAKIKQLTASELGKVAEKLMDLGNVAAGALLFGQAIAGNGFDFQIGVIGLVCLSILYVAALSLMRLKGGERN